MPPPHNSHDSLVKHIFSNPEAAAAELRTALPAALVQHLDWATLALRPGSFVDPELRHRNTDLLYSVCLRDGPELAIYVLLEHQSTVDPRMAVRFFVYVGRIYEQLLRQQPSAKTVPLVIPVLLFQGKGGWTASRKLSDCFALPRSLREQLALPIELCFDIDDLSESVVQDVGRAQLRRDRGLALAEMARTLLWLYRHPEASTGRRAVSIGQLIDAIVDAWGVRAIEPFFVYLLSAFGPKTPIRGIMLEAANQETRHLYATIREQLIAEGRQVGVAEGRRVGVAEGRRVGVAEGRRAGVADGLAWTMLQLFETRGLTVSVAQRQRIERCRDEAILRQWFVRAMTASSVEDVLGD